MNGLQLATTAQFNWERHAKNSFNSYEPRSTWAQDLAIAMFYENVEKGAIEKTINDAIKAWKSQKGHHMLIMLGCAIKYMCEFCYYAKDSIPDMAAYFEYWEVFDKLYWEYAEKMNEIDEDIYCQMHYYLD